MKNKGKLIVFEGIDGSGKTTQAQLLISALTSRNIKATYLHFPRVDNEHSLYGRFIKSYLKGELGQKETIDPFFIAFLYAGDRKEMSTEITLHLNSGSWVILDRYVFSNMAYQGARVSEEKKQAFIQWVLLTEFETFELPRPDITFFLDMPLEFTIGNLSKHRNQKDRVSVEADIHEKDVMFQQQVREMYLHVFKKEKDVITIAYNDPVNIPSPVQIHNEILQHLL
jgi:dTMP kinase